MSVQRSSRLQLKFLTMHKWIRRYVAAAESEECMRSQLIKEVEKQETHAEEHKGLSVPGSNGVNK